MPFNKHIITSEFVIHLKKGFRLTIRHARLRSAFDVVDNSLLTNGWYRGRWAVVY